MSISSIDTFTMMRIKMKFGLASRISLYERLAAFLKAGIPVFEAVAAIRNRYQKRKDVRYVMLNSWIASMKEEGMQFADAIKPWIPASEYMLISSGARGEGLVSGLTEAARLSTAANKIKKAIFVGAAMPILLVVMLAGMIAGFDIYMAPVFVNLLPVPQWPEGARMLYNISTFITGYWYFIVGIFGTIATLISLTMNSWTVYPRNIFDHMPPWSIYKGYQASSFLIGLASMLKAGVALNDALKVMRKNSSPWMIVHLDKMLGTLRIGGANYGEALDTGLFDEDTAGDIIDYAKLSSFENAIYVIGEKMVEEGVTKTNERMAVIKNLMLFLVAGTVFWIYFTSYDLQSTIAERMQQRGGGR